jgi:hypothetical protein
MSQTRMTTDPSGRDKARGSPNHPRALRNRAAERDQLLGVAFNLKRFSYADCPYR